LSWRDALMAALESLAGRKLRSALTVLGIVFGVGAVIAMLSIGAGAERQALETISRLGLENVLVRARVDLRDEELREIRRKSPGVSLRDAEAIRQSVPGVAVVAAKIEIDPYKVLSGASVTEAKVFGVEDSHDQLVEIPLAEGRFFDAIDLASHAQVAVVGDRTARELFGFDSAIGQLVKINDVWFEVVGVLASALDGASDSFQGVQINSTSDTIFVPVTTALRKFDHRPLDSPLSEIVVRLERTDAAPTAARLIDDLLGRLHGGERDYELVVPEALLAESRRTQRLFNIVMGCIAGISLLVGGIGIMNIMLASVFERTHEIGVRRALGARRRDVLAQFITEAFSLSVFGGISGIVVGVAIARIIAGRLVDDRDRRFDRPVRRSRDRRGPRVRPVSGFARS